MSSAAVATIRDALRLSAHVVVRDPTQLAGQLVGRLGDLPEPGVERLVEAARVFRGEPWLRPASASLTAPGGPLFADATRAP